FLTVAAFRVSIDPPAGMKIAIRTGFVILCAAMATGVAMIARGMMFVLGGRASVAYATGGLLKPTHAVTMHAILVLPALAWLLSRAGWSDECQRRYVAAASMAYGLAALIVAAWNVATASW